MKIVAQGKASPTRSAPAKPTRWRASPPSALPSATQRYIMAGMPPNSLRLRSPLNISGRRQAGALRQAFAPVLQHLHLFEGDETARHHGVERREKALDPLLAVDDLDHHGEVFGEAKDLRRVETARMTKAHGPAQHGGAA